MASTERLPANTKLMFPDATFLKVLALPSIGRGILAADSVEFLQEFLQQPIPPETAAEYDSLYGTLEQLVGKENILLLRTSVVYGEPIFGGNFAPAEYYDSNQVARGSVILPFLDRYAHHWPRDNHWFNGTQLFGNRSHWAYHDKKVIISPLGDSGRVLQSGPSIIVCQDVWDQPNHHDLKKLAAQNYHIGVVPNVDPFRQQHDFNREEKHIDGHSGLVKDGHMGRHLLVAKSFATQSRSAYPQIREAARDATANLVVVDDKYLPPLSFNFLQLEDGTVVMTEGAEELEQVMRFLVGSDKVVKTVFPAQIHTIALGGIRCLTNVLPELPPWYWNRKQISIEQDDKLR